MPYIKIPLCGKRGQGKYTLVDGDYDGEYFSQFRWYISTSGYAYRILLKSSSPELDNNRLVFLHHEVLKTDKARAGYLVRDHIDRNKLNNRSCNLRLVPHLQNLFNTDSKSNSKSGYRGIYKIPNSNRYYVVLGGKYLGVVNTIKEGMSLRSKGLLIFS